MHLNRRNHCSNGGRDCIECLSYPAFVGKERAMHWLELDKMNRWKSRWMTPHSIQHSFFKAVIISSIIAILVVIKYVFSKEEMISVSRDFSLDIGTIVVIGIISPTVEELFFRGALQPRVGIWITSIAFTLTHVQYDLEGLLNVFMASIFYGWIAHRYSIWLSIGVHILWNFFMIMIILIRT